MPAPLPLSAARAELAAALAAGRRVELFTDFDGTLVDIHDLPFDCYPSPGVRSALAAIAGHPRAVAAVVSGRDLADLRPRVGVEGLYFAGNHGLEIAGPGIAFVSPGAAARRDLLAGVLVALQPAIAAIPGAWVQDKGLSASVHFRQTPADWVPAVAAAVERAVDPHRGEFVLRGGKAVLEIRPAVDWHKGAAVRWLAERLAGDRPPGEPAPVCVFLGDDATDEDAFGVLPDGVTVLVGPDRPTAARFRTDRPADVEAFLGWLAAELG